MNAVRCTSYLPNGDGTPESFGAMTIVVRESDVREGVSLAELTMDDVELGDRMGIFVVTETFDVPDDVSIEEASGVAIGRQVMRDETERYMACLYHYETRALAHAAPNAVLVGTIPAPLSAEDVAFALRRVGAYSGYARQTVIMPCEEGRTIVRLVAGEIETEEVPGGTNEQD